MSKRGEYVQIWVTNETTGIRYWIARANGEENKTDYAMLHKTKLGAYIQYDLIDQYGISDRVTHDIIRFKRVATAKKTLILNDYHLLMEFFI